MAVDKAWSARVIDGTAKAEAIVSTQPFGFFGGVNPSTGLIIDKWHDLYGQNIKGKILDYPEGRGSTVGAAVVLELARAGLKMRREKGWD